MLEERAHNQIAPLRDSRHSHDYVSTGAVTVNADVVATWLQPPILSDLIES